MLRLATAALVLLAFALGAGTLARADVIDEPEMEEPAPPPGRRPPPAEQPPPAPPPPAPPAVTPAAPEPAAEECVWLPDIRCGRHGRWDGFEMPIVQFPLFEDPFIVTGVYPFFLWQEFPGRSALQGGDVKAFSIQARLALTDRLAFIATKDGRVWEDPDNPLLPETKGFMNLAAGFKYALVQMPETPFILSAILRLEVPTGSSDIFEGADGGVIFMPSISAALGLDRLHLIADVGGQAPTDGDTYSSNIFYHLYADYSVHRYFQPFVQLSGIHYVTSGDGSRPIRLVNGVTITHDVAVHALRTGHFEGGDLHNLGSRGIDNADYVTWAVGAHVPINKHVTFSAAYERPLSDRKDITKQRVTTALRLEF